VDVNKAVGVWIDGWARGWRDHDTEPIAALYADDALFVSAPFRDPLRGGAGAAEYARWAFADEAAVELWFAEPVIGDDRAAIPYWAVVRGHGGESSTLAGIADVRFAADGRVVAQRDYWTVEANVAHEPPDGWGPIAAHERRD
jgi:ketosteroid isomerase-like protein